MRDAFCRTFFGIAFGCLLVGALPLRAGSEIEEEKADPPDPSWSLGDWGGRRTKLADRGVYLSLDYTTDVLGNPVGGKRQGAAFEGAFNLEIEVELEYIIGWRGATFAASAAYAHGSNYSEHEVGDLNGTTNLESYDTARLLELWFEQKGALGPVALSLRLGSQAVDAEFWLNPRENVLLNNSFGTPLTFSGNFPIPSYALAAVGARLAAMIGRPSERAALLQIGIFDGNPASGVLHDPTPNSTAPADFNKHGTNWTLRRAEGALLVGETGFTFNQPREDPDDSADEADEGKEAKKMSPPPRGLAGNYRLGIIHHTDRFADAADTALLNQEVEIGHDPARSVRGNTSLYFMVDQELWREPGSDAEGLSLFGRAAFAPKRQNHYDYSWETGLNYLGLLPGRAQDQLVLGFGFTHINPRVAAAVREANRDLTRRRLPDAAREVERARREVADVDHDPEDFGQTQADVSDALAELAAAQENERAARREDEINRRRRRAVPDYEAVMELGYRAQITPWLVIQPDVQWIMHPGGSTAIDDALIIGIRAAVTF